MGQPAVAASDTSHHLSVLRRRRGIFVSASFDIGLIIVLSSGSNERTDYCMTRVAVENDSHNWTSTRLVFLVRQSLRLCSCSSLSAQICGRSQYWPPQPQTQLPEQQLNRFNIKNISVGPSRTTWWFSTSPIPPPVLRPCPNSAGLFVNDHTLSCTTILKAVPPASQYAASR